MQREETDDILCGIRWILENGQMTKREAFAMAAMQGLLAYPGSVLSGSYHTNASAYDAAKAAVMYADALLSALDGPAT